MVSPFQSKRSVKHEVGTSSLLERMPLRLIGLRYYERTTKQTRWMRWLLPISGLQRIVMEVTPEVALRDENFGGQLAIEISFPRRKLESPTVYVS